MKKIIQIIYGMQYEELEQNGKDGNKARLNGNVLVSAYIIVAIFLVVLIGTFVPEYNESINRFFRGISGVLSGKTIGKLLAIPLFAVIYFIVANTIGSETSFQQHVEAYKRFSEEDKKKSLMRAMLPFMTMLAMLLVLSIIQL